MVRYKAKTLIMNVKRHVVMTMLGVFGVFIASQAHAQFAAEPCDPQYYESLEARAWLEAQREITQNQNLIYKSDSVLEYTCFDRFLAPLAQHGSPGGSLFTGTNRWGGPPGNMQTTLRNVVGAALNTYDTTNFNHNLLGGRAPGPYSPTAISAGTYTCNTMDQVWRFAKCQDFVVDPATDGFFTFTEYANAADRRTRPTACQGGAFTGGRTADYQTNIDRAVVDASTPWDEDVLLTYYDLLYPPSGCSTTSPTIPWATSLIRTGLIVDRSNGVPFQEHVCVVPGCHYQPGPGATGGSCVP